MRTKKNKVARNIVANLAWRYRLAARLERKQRGISQIHNEALNAHTLEAWNAYISASRVLLGILE